MKFLRNAAIALLLLCLTVFATSQVAPTAGQPVHLRFVCWDGDEASKALRAEIGRFEVAHPNIVVKFETVNSDYFEKLLNEYAADVAPDVAMMDPGDFQRYARRGAILPLNQFFGDIPGFNIKDYYPSIVDAHSLNGQLYVLPRDIAPESIVYYNRNMLRAAGLPDPPADWTWDFTEHPEKGPHDFLTYLHRLQKKDSSGRVVAWGYVPGWQTLLTQMFMFSTGARYVDDPKDPKKILYSDPRLIRAYQFSADLTLKQKYIPTSFDQQGTDARQMFTQGKVAMFQSGIWETPQLREEIPPVSKGGFEWDIAMAPAYIDGTRAYPTGGSGYSIMSKTRHPHEAWLLTQWMAGEHGMMAMARAGIAQPAISKLARAEPWVPGPHTPANQQVPHNRIITDLSVPYVVFNPTGILSTEVLNILGQPESSIYTGDMKAQDALMASGKIAQDRLDTLRKEENLPPFNWTLGGVLGLGLGLLIIAWVYAPERKIRRTDRQKRENRAAYAFIAVWLFGMVAFTAGPMILSLLMSFADWDIIRPARWRGLGNYQEAFTVDPTFWKSMTVTLIYTVVSVPAGICVSLALALLLNAKVRGIAIWRTCFYIPAMASPIAGSLIWLKLFQPEGGLLNTVIFGADGHGGIPFLASLLHPLVGVNGAINWLQNEKTALGSMIFMSLFGAGGGMIILLAGLQGVPQYYYEAATLDGANKLKQFRNITIPLISPSLFFVTITGFIGSFQVFTQAFQMTQGGPNNATMFYMLHLYNNAFRILRMGYASAMAWVLFFVILVFTVIQMQGNRFVHYEGGR